MRLNREKTNVIIFNYTLNYHFSTRLYIEETILEIVQETKLLGCILTSDLTWWEITNYITRKAYQSLDILRYQIQSMCLWNIGWPLRLCDALLLL